MGLHHPRRRVDLPVDDEQRAASGGLRVGGDAQGVEQIAGPVGTGLGRVPHRTGEDHRPAGRRQGEQMGQPGRVGDGVGAVQHHHAVMAPVMVPVVGAPVEGRPAPPGQLQHLRGPDRVAGPAEELLDADLQRVPQAGVVGQQLLDDPGAGQGGDDAVGAGPAGDGSAGGEDEDAGHQDLRVSRVRGGQATGSTAARPSIRPAARSAQA
ncbi:hypothetical protein SDC9_136877 [bioreactor metagenome]|uniref:Uncharacterized protein n=1 Tax=bioreactor metagenome TaxID=1076179 RepID=A0A645DKH1_9ZZZZ